jgi:hypothetical protein
LPGNRRVAACRRRSKPRATNTSRMAEHSENRVTIMKEHIGAMSDEEMATDRWENEGSRTPTK